LKHLRQPCPKYGLILGVMKTNSEKCKKWPIKTLKNGKGRGKTFNADKSLLG
jgi:hypothetical protein